MWWVDIRMARITLAKVWDYELSDYYKRWQL